ncbi:MAG: hypothetical protein S4CHLAM2_11250 [Chlamydiales bacterium]|nr:hypothetical protein [Chlamydiales bacterium]
MTNSISSTTPICSLSLLPAGVKDHLLSFVDQVDLQKVAETSRSLLCTLKLRELTIFIDQVIKTLTTNNFTDAIDPLSKIKPSILELIEKQSSLRRGLFQKKQAVITVLTQVPRKSLDALKEEQGSHFCRKICSLAKVFGAIKTLQKRKSHTPSYQKALSRFCIKLEQTGDIRSAIDIMHCSTKETNNYRLGTVFDVLVEANERRHAIAAAKLITDKLSRDQKLHACSVALIKAGKFDVLVEAEESEHAIAAATSITDQRSRDQKLHAYSVALVKAGKIERAIEIATQHIHDQICFNSVLIHAFKALLNSKKADRATEVAFLVRDDSIKEELLERLR